MSEVPTRDELVLIGRLSRPFGVQGETRLVPESEEADWLFSLSEDQFYLLRPNAPPLPIRAQFRRWQGGVLLLALEGVETPEAAAQLSGCWLAVHESLRPPAPEGEFYIDQLAGLRVFNPQHERIGTVARVIESRGEMFFEVRLENVELKDEESGKSNQTFLLSPAKELIEKIDLQAGEIHLRIAMTE